MDLKFLNIEKSLSSREWISPSAEIERLASGLQQKHDISFLTALLLCKRGVRSNEVDLYLSPKIKNLMPDPYSLKDMQNASKRLIKAINKNEKICIYADYDVDGVTSASILKLWLKHFQISPEIYIPDRIKEGYGPNLTAMETLSQNNQLIICVDCGTVSHDEISIANNNGAEVLIIDHHLADANLPQALAVVNPKRQDESGELDYLCAAGLVFIFLVSVSRLLREKGAEPPNLLNFLDLVALATVADVVPLIKLNRAFVKQGLKVLAKRNRPGLVALIDEAKIKTATTSYHVGFLLAPRINAAGRLSDAKFAVNLLTATTEKESATIAQELNDLNIKRRSLEKDALNEAIAQIEMQGKDKGNLIWVANESWHPGVIGIVASKLKDKFQVPSLVFSIDKKGVAVGSARSVAEVDIGSEIKKLLETGLILSGGGHQMAAGLKIVHKQLSDAMFALNKNITNITKDSQLQSKLEIDALLTTKGASIELVDEISLVGPFGASSPYPVICIPYCQVRYLKIFTDKHIKFVCIDETAKSLEAIFFNGVETPGGQQLLKNNGESFHLCGKLEVNDWGGHRRVVLQVEDVATV